MAEGTGRSAATKKLTAVDLAGIRGARLLLAEDNILNQQVAEEILTAAGFIVDMAGNGQIALERVQNYPYDAVLMDVQMPAILSIGLATGNKIVLGLDPVDQPLLMATILVSS